MIDYRMLRGTGILALVLLVAPGCVERKLFIRTDPPGAQVALNREDPVTAATPLEVEFDHYGDFHVRVTKDGHLPLEVVEPVTAPWWAWPPFDLVTDLLLPFTIRDHRELDYTLRPEPPPLTYEEAVKRHPGMIERAEELRRKVNEGDPAEAE